jgi:hypothetical protein
MNNRTVPLFFIRIRSRRQEAQASSILRRPESIPATVQRLQARDIASPPRKSDYVSDVLAAKLAVFSDRFSPRTVATYNNNDIMVAKLEGPFHWHKRDDTEKRRPRSLMKT